ncbi:hypothetical protein BDR22DRAFT_892292 [Usnea florida]
MATSSATSGLTSPKLKSKNIRRSPTLYDTIIYVNVGPTRERFGIHKSLLSHHSSYFKAALEGGFEESKTGVINLRDEDPDVFWAFKEWLYSDAVAYQHYPTHDGKWSALINFYVFAEKNIIPKFQNALIDAMIGFASESETYTKRVISLAWVNTPTSSPLRTFLVDVYARCVPIAECFRQITEKRECLRQITEKRECFDIDFVKRVAIALDDMVEDPRGYRNGLDGLRKDRCLWHVHGPGHPPCHDGSSPTDSK